MEILKGLVFIIVINAATITAVFKIIQLLNKIAEKKKVKNDKKLSK